MRAGAECCKPPRRISIAFAHESLADILDEESNEDDTVFVIKGVVMCPKTEAFENTINTIQDLFPFHVLYCDLMPKKFFTRFAQGVHSKIVASGGKFSARPDFPEAISTQHGDKPMERIPMSKQAEELGILRGAVKMPLQISWHLLYVFLKDFGGCAVHRLYFAKI